MTDKALTIIQVLPKLNGGGVEKGTLEIGRFLVEQGHRSIVVSGGGRMVEQLTREGSEHILACIGEKSLLTLKYIAWFKRLLLDIKPDIVHLRSRLPAWICYLAWKQLPKQQRPRLITTVHGQHSINAYSNIMHCGERVITVSNFMREHIIKHYPSTLSSVIKVIHRGVDSKKFQASYQPTAAWKGEWYTQFPETLNKQLLCFPGRLSRRKGVEDFLIILEQVVAVIPTVHGLIVGEPEPSNTRYLDELKAIIRERNLQSYVTFTGHRQDLIDIMSESSVVLSLSNKPEAFGRTVSESLSLKTPVIGYDHGGVAEQLKLIFPQGLTPPLRPILAADKLISLLKNNVRVNNNSPFTLNNMCQQTLSVYQELLASD
jgi:glycosyltransferase involved in cell wall biosynthesis